MRESIGSAWLYGLVLTFILLFTGFLTLIIDYSGAFMYKNDVIEIIEKYEGYTLTSRSIIDDYLTNSGYKTKSDCPDTYYGATSLDGKTGSVGAQNAYYCIKENGDKMDFILFYSFNLPILGDLIKFNIEGQTNSINYLTVYSKFKV